MNELSIVIPVFNSSTIIEELIDRIQTVLHSKLSYEIILVNDSSFDNSWQKIREQASIKPNITGVNLRKNSGQDNAILAGLRISKGNFVIIMDDDLQHDPKDIIPLYEECKKGYDVCYANFEKRNQQKIKKMGSDINGIAANSLINKPKELYLSPFKIIKKEVVKEICNFTGPYPYIDGIILSITNNIQQISVEHHQRHSGKSNYTFSRSISVFMKLFTGFSIIPLRIATFMGVITTSIGCLLAVKYLYDYFIKKDFIEGWTTVVILILFFGGLILITLGIIGEYIGRTYLAVNKKPQYSIDEIVKSNE